jgi:hypothetical protein
MNIAEIIYDEVLPADMNEELWRLMRRLDKADLMNTAQAHEAAIRRNEYRKAKAQATLKYKTDPQYIKATVQHLEALVDTDCEDQRFAAYIAEASAGATLESIRSLRAQLSALQSIAAGMRSEMEMASGAQPRW